MTNIETIHKIENYLIKKNIEFKFKSIENYNIIFTYDLFDFDFIIKINLIPDINDNFIVRYYANYDVLNIKRLKTSTHCKNYLSNIYNNLCYIKYELYRLSYEKNLKLYNKQKYCAELNSYYKKIHRNISIDVKIDDDCVNIVITGYDENKITNYYITIIENKYYLESLNEEYLIK